MNTDPRSEMRQATPTDLSGLVRRTIGKLKVSLLHYYAGLAIIGISLSCLICHHVTVDYAKNYAVYDPQQHDGMSYQATINLFSDPYDDPQVYLPCGHILIGMMLGTYVIANTESKFISKRRAFWAIGFIMSCGFIAYVQIVWLTSGPCWCDKSNLVKLASTEFDDDTYYLTIDSYIAFDWRSDHNYLYLHQCQLDGTNCSGRFLTELNPYFWHFDTVEMIQNEEDNELHILLGNDSDTWCYRIVSDDNIPQDGTDAKEFDVMECLN